MTTESQALEKIKANDAQISALRSALLSYCEIESGSITVDEAYQQKAEVLKESIYVMKTSNQMLHQAFTSSEAIIRPYKLNVKAPKEGLEKLCDQLEKQISEAETKIVQIQGRPNRYTNGQDTVKQLEKDLQGLKDQHKKADIAFHAVERLFQDAGAQ